MSIRIRVARLVARGLAPGIAVVVAACGVLLLPDAVDPMRHSTGPSANCLDRNSRPVRSAMPSSRGTSVPALGSARFSSRPHAARATSPMAADTRSATSRGLAGQPQAASSRWNRTGDRSCRTGRSRALQPKCCPSAPRPRRIMAPAVSGLGLLEAVPDSALIALADPDDPADRNGDGISGRLSLVAASPFVGAVLAYGGASAVEQRCGGCSARCIGCSPNSTGRRNSAVKQ